MNKRFWAIIGIIVVLFAGALWMNNNSKNKNTGTDSGAKPTSHIRGDTASKVKLVEYGDFQCPYCAEYYKLVDQVYQKYQDKISFQFSHLPLNQVHQNAFAAARASEAAADQGKFWQMYDLLYQNQSEWSSSNNASSIFEGYAQRLSLNLTQYKKDFSSTTVNDRINADKDAFNKLGLEVSTPTFLLDGKKIQPTSVDGFSKLIDAELKKQAGNS